MARKHIYAVNWSPEFLGIIRALLQDEQYNVTTNFIPNSFETMETAQPSLLIIDLIVGEQAGWDLLGRLRASLSTREIPVILIFGGDHYLVKQFNLNDLLQLIAELIGKAQAAKNACVL